MRPLHRLVRRSLISSLTKSENDSGQWRAPEFVTEKHRERNLLKQSGFENPPAVMTWRRMPNWEARVLSWRELSNHRSAASELALQGFRPVVRESE